MSVALKKKACGHQRRVNKQLKHIEQTCVHPLWNLSVDSHLLSAHPRCALPLPSGSDAGDSAEPGGRRTFDPNGGARRGASSHHRVDAQTEGEQQYSQYSQSGHEERQSRYRAAIFIKLINDVLMIDDFFFFFFLKG